MSGRRRLDFDRHPAYGKADRAATDCSGGGAGKDSHLGVLEFGSIEAEVLDACIAIASPFNGRWKPGKYPCSGWTRRHHRGTGFPSESEPVAEVEAVAHDATQPGEKAGEGVGPVSELKWRRVRATQNPHRAICPCQYPSQRLDFASLGDIVPRLAGSRFFRRSQTLACGGPVLHGPHHSE